MFVGLFYSFLQILTIESIEVCERKWDCFEMSAVEIPRGRKWRVFLLFLCGKGGRRGIEKPLLELYFVILMCIDIKATG